MYNNNINKLLGLKDVLIKNIKNSEKTIEIQIELPKVKAICPCCKSSNTKVHDYRIHKIKDEPIRHKTTILLYRKRRYHCKNCNKNFFETNEFVLRYKRTTKNLIEYVVNELKTPSTQKDIAKRADVAPSFVSKLLPYLAVTNTHLPKVLCIDEFKGNSGNYKYQVILLDGETHKVVDVIECRHKSALNSYFKKFSKEELNNVRFLVSDLWTTYRDLVFAFFRKAIHIADHFHFIRYAVGAVDKIRRKVQSKLPKNERIYFKHSRRLLLGNFSSLKKQQDFDELELMLINYSEDLRIAYLEKEKFINIFSSKDSEETKIKQLSNWILRNETSDIPELVECANTFQHWFQSIKNSILQPFSNGPTEGMNNKIKTLKRFSYGMHKFISFKARILLLCT